MVAAPEGRFARRVRRPIMALLQAGATPEKLALSLALGLALGIFPVVGATTLMCVAVALALRLNLVAIQIVNYLAYPVHLALLIPFVRVGEWICGAEPIPLSIALLQAGLRADLGGTLRRLWRTEVHAITAWSLTAPFLAVVAYFAFLPLLRALARKLAGPAAAASAAS